MPTAVELETKWSQRLEEWRALGVSVSGEKIASEILNDLRSMETARAVELLTPSEAAEITHYHSESICRMIRVGKVKNYGTKHRPRVKLSELPRKAPESSRPRRRVAQGGTSSTSSVVPIDSVARDALAGRLGRV